MRLRLNVCDVDLWLKIYDYKKSHDNDYVWGNTDFSLKGKYINYDIVESEVLLNSEVDEMKFLFKDLLEGNLKEKVNLTFIEPDFELDLFPSQTLYSEKGKVWYRDGSVTIDVYVDFKVHFWCNSGLGTNVFKVTLDREYIKVFYVYLQLVTGEIDKESEIVGKYINEGYIYI